MIAEALAGRRIAVTGATGFLGTALVERLLRPCPAASSCCSCGPGRRTSAEQRVRREVAPQRRLRPPAGPSSSGGTTFDAEVARRRHGDRRRRRHRRARPGRRRAAGPGRRATSSSTRPPPSPSTRPSTAPSRSTCSGPCRIAETLRDARLRRPTSSPCPPATWPATAGAGPPRSRSTPALHPRRRLAGRGGRRPPHPGRRRGREPHAPTSWPASPRRPGAELGAAGTPLLATKAEQLRQAWVTDELVEAGRARARSLGWPDAYAYTKALGERALLETRGDVPVTHRAALDHRVGPRRAPARAGSGASAWPSR